MAQYSSGRLAILITTLVLPPAHAQQISSSAMQLPPPVIRVVDSCQKNNPDTPCEHISPDLTLKTITFQIPEFQPGDENTHIYVVARINNGGGFGAGTARADENGLLRERVAIDSDSQADAHYYFITFDRDTLESRITLDLYEVGLWPFLNSLQGALQMGVRAATGFRFGQAEARSLMTELQKYQNQKFSIHGEHLTMDELLDKLYQETRCIVDHEADGLVIADCP